MGSITITAARSALNFCMNFPRTAKGGKAYNNPDAQDTEKASTATALESGFHDIYVSILTLQTRGKQVNRRHTPNGAQVFEDYGAKFPFHVIM